MKIKSIKLLFNPDLRKIQPEDYLRATGECFGLMILSSIILTYFFSPELFNENPILNRLGYNSIFISFLSYVPANYIALIFGVFGVYFAIHYNRYDLLRTRLNSSGLNSFKEKFSIYANLTYLFSLTAFLLVIFLNPENYPWANILIFIQFIFFRGMVVIANFLEYDTPNKFYKNYVLINSITSLIFISFLLINYINYDSCLASGGTNCKNTIPLYLGISIDYLWIIQGILYTFLPFQGESIKLQYSASFKD